MNCSIFSPDWNSPLLHTQTLLYKPSFLLTCVIQRDNDIPLFLSLLPISRKLPPLEPGSGTSQRQTPLTIHRAPDIWTHAYRAYGGPTSVPCPSSLIKDSEILSEYVGSQGVPSVLFLHWKIRWPFSNAQFSHRQFSLLTNRPWENTSSFHWVSSSA